MVEASPDLSDNSSKITVRVASIGNVDSGKSTLVGIITSQNGIADDGRGSLRKKVFNYSHEIENGRTSSIAYEIVCFDSNGEQVVPESKSTKKKVTWPDMVQRSAKIVSLNDLCGHEKYLKTTMYGLSGLFPHYGMVVIGANMGIQRMTKEHIGISISLKIPFFIVITKIDLAPKEVYEQTKERLFKILNGSGCNKKPFNVTSEDELPMLVENMKDKTNICPVFSVSNVTRIGIDMLKKFFSLLEPNDRVTIQDKSASNPADQMATQVDESINDRPAIFVIDSFFPNVKGVGSCVCGTVLQGTIRRNMILHIGPDSNGHFNPLVIKGIHENRVDIEEATFGQSVCFAIKPAPGKKDMVMKKNFFRKGLILIDEAAGEKIKGKKEVSLAKFAVREFEADVQVLHHATTIKEGY
jgi:GTPase